jgi:hypothetical protein
MECGQFFFRGSLLSASEGVRGTRRLSKTPRPIGNETVDRWCSPPLPRTTSTCGRQMDRSDIETASNRSSQLNPEALPQLPKNFVLVLTKEKPCRVRLREPPVM